MSILKALFLTLFILGIEALIQILILVVFPIEGPFSNNSITYGLSLIIGRIAAYGLAFLLFLNFSFQGFSGKFRTLDGYTLFLIPVIIIGFEFGIRPFLDINEIADSWGPEGLLPYNYKFAGYTPNFAYRIVTALLLAPVLEELFFRKYLLSGLLTKYSKFLALVFSSLLFSIIHWETPLNLLPTFFFGMVSGGVYIRTGNITYSILLHFLANLLSVLMEINGSLYYDWLFRMNFGFLYWSLCGIGILCILLAIRKLKPGSREIPTPEYHLKSQ